MKLPIVVALFVLAPGCGTKVSGDGSGSGGGGGGGGAVSLSSGSVGGAGGTGASASASSGRGGADATVSSSGSGSQGEMTPHPVCGDEFVDFDCDGQLGDIGYGCPPGQHLDLVDGDHCAGCVADTAQSETCTWGRSRYLGFLEELATASCADFCSTDEDCSVITVDNSCYVGCSYALFGGIDEEVLMAGNLFANESCSTCTDLPPPCASAGSTPACVDHRCVLR